MISHRTRFRGNGDLPLWRGSATKKKPPFFNARALMTHETMRSRDAQCSSGNHSFRVQGMLIQSGFFLYRVRMKQQSTMRLAACDVTPVHLPFCLNKSGRLLRAKARFSACSVVSEYTDNWSAVATIEFITVAEHISRGDTPDASYRKYKCYTRLIKQDCVMRLCHVIVSRTTQMSSISFSEVTTLLLSTNKSRPVAEIRVASISHSGYSLYACPKSL